MPLACENYDLAEAKLKAFTRSSIRTRVMLCLLKGNLSAGDMQEELGSRATTILHTIKDMTEEKLVSKKGLGYELTNTGRMQALVLENLISTLESLDQHHDFWLNHDLSGIPLELQKNIGMLIQSEIITSDSSTPLLVLENFLAELDRAKEIHGVSSVIYPGFSEAIAGAIKRGIRVDLILSDKILEIAAKSHMDLGKELLKHDNFRLYSIDMEVKVAFTVTDAILSLGLFRLNGDYDVGNDLICRGDGAMKWGMELFNYYLSISKQVMPTAIYYKKE